MKRLKKISILLAVLIIVCAAAYGVSRYEEHKENIKNSDEIILALDNSSVTSLAFEYDSTSLAFHKDESAGWLYDSDEDFPVDEDKINELLDVFSSFGAAFIIEDVEDYSQYGLDEPTCTISLSTSDNSYEVQLGSFSTMDSKRYISIGDGNVYLSAEDPFVIYEVTLEDMIEHDELPTLTKADSIHFTVNEDKTDRDNDDDSDSDSDDDDKPSYESYDIYREDENTYTYCADDIYFTNRDDSVLALDSSKIKSYLSSAGSIEHSDYVTYNVSKDELSEYGLDSPEFTVSIEYTITDEDENETANTLKLDVSTVNDSHYLRINDSQIVYILSDSGYSTLTATSYDTLRHDDIFTANFDDVTRIDVSLEDSTYTFTTETTDDKTTYYYNDTEISITDLKSALTALNADSFTNEDASEKEEISLTLYLNNDAFPQATISLYRYDGSYCLAIVDGKSVALVKRSQVVDLIEAVNAIILSKNEK